MKKTNTAVLVLSIVAAAVSVIALAVSVAALIRTFGKDRPGKGEYGVYDDDDIAGEYSDMSGEDIGSDTLAF